MSLFEVIMLVCFGAAWPFSIYRSYISKSNGGKDIRFLLVIEVGYVSGILHKLLYNFNGVFYLYALNSVLVLADILLYLRNSKLAVENSG